MKKGFFTAAAVLIPLLAPVNCTTGIAGNDPGGSEITNGKVLTRAGSPAGGVTVAAYPLSYIAEHSSMSTVVTAETGDDGIFTLAIDSGSYNLFIIDSSSASGCAIRNVGPKTGLGILRLDSLGTIEGVIRTDSSSAAATLIIYSQGTPFRINSASADGRFRFIHVPPGSYPLTVAKKPKVGCIPGIDCLPGGGTPGKEGEIGSATVLSGETVVINTSVTVENLKELH